VVQWFCGWSYVSGAIRSDAAAAAGVVFYTPAVLRERE